MFLCSEDILTDVKRIKPYDSKKHGKSNINFVYPVGRIVEYDGGGVGLVVGFILEAATDGAGENKFALITTMHVKDEPTNFSELLTEQGFDDGDYIIVKLPADRKNDKILKALAQTAIEGLLNPTYTDRENYGCIITFK